MLKMTIDNEEVVSDKDITINEEMLSASSTILNNVYPKEWEEDKDYTSRFYYPQDYSKALIQRSYVTQEAEAGTTIQVNGSVTLTDVDTTKNSRVLRLLGQTSQTGTPTPSSPIPVNVVSGDNEIVVCGKNLLPNDNTTQTINGVTFTKNDDGSINLSGTSTGYTDYYLVGGASQYDSLGVSSGTYNLNGVTNGALNTYMLYMVKNSGGTLSYLQSVNTAGLSVSIQSTDTFRIFIRVLNGQNVNNVVIKPMINKGSTALPYEPYIGNTYNIDLPVENLFDVSLLPKTLNGITISQNDEGNIVLNGTPDINSGYINFQVSNAKQFEAGTYTISVKEKKAGVGLVVQNWTGSGINLTLSDIVKTKTDTAPTSFSGNLQINVRYDVGTLTDFVLNPQLEKSSKANSYTPYGTTPIELCKIGNYQDYIYKDSDKWYLYKEIGKVASYNGETITTSYLSTTGGLDTGATIYYGLSTPTNTEITYQPLIEQLNALSSQ